MKNIFVKLSALSVLLLLCWGCNDDFLEQHRLDAVSTSNYWNKRANVESNLAAIYSVNIFEKWEHIRLLVPELLRGDDCYPKHVVGWYGRTGNFTNNSSYEGSCENRIWEKYYRGIFYANQVITYTPDSKEIPAVVKDSLIAEARFMRGYYHFELYKHFKNIIYMDVLPQSLSELYPPQTPLGKILEKLEADFKFAAAFLPERWNTDNVGRATKGAALGYLGKSYLWFKEYSKADSAFNAVENLSQKYQLVSASNWGKQFYGTSENSTESIFEIQFRQKDIADNRYSMLQFVLTPYHWGELAVSDTLFNAFIEEVGTDKKWDTRLTQSVAWYDSLEVDFKGEKLIGTIVGNDEAIIQAKDIPYFKTTFEEYGVKQARRAGLDFYNSNWIKHRWIKKHTEVGSEFVGDEMTGVNFIRMRYADLILMHAEALNEIGETAKAATELNRVRTRVKLSPVATDGSISQPEMREKIRRERWKELAFEGHRYFDLVRWYSGDEIKNILLQANYPDAQNYQVNKHEWLPIPLQDIQANPSIIQNTGF